MGRWFHSKHDGVKKPCQWHECRHTVSQRGNRYCHFHQHIVSQRMERSGFLEPPPDMYRNTYSYLPRTPHAGEESTNWQEVARRIQEEDR
jgi:hypothetical protein